MEIIGKNIAWDFGSRISGKISARISAPASKISACCGPLGNEIQFRFNKSLDNRLKNASEELRKIPVSEEPAVEGSSEVRAAVTAARVELTEGR